MSGSRPRNFKIYKYCGRMREDFIFESLSTWVTRKIVLYVVFASGLDESELGGHDIQDPQFQ